MKLKELEQQVMALVRSSPDGVERRAILSATSAKITILYRCLRGLVTRGELTRVSRGRYSAGSALNQTSTPAPAP